MKLTIFKPLLVFEVKTDKTTIIPQGTYQCNIELTEDTHEIAWREHISKDEPGKVATVFIVVVGRENKIVYREFSEKTLTDPVFAESHGLIFED